MFSTLNVGIHNNIRLINDGIIINIFTICFRKPPLKKYVNSDRYIHDLDGIVNSTLQVGILINKLKNNNYYDIGTVNMC